MSNNSEQAGQKSKGKGDAKEVSSFLLDERRKADFYVIGNPSKPLEEYIIVFPHQYKEDLKYSDYINMGLRIFSCEPLAHLSNFHS